MSDDNDSGGIIGTIISIFILAAIWPYLLAILVLYIAYVAFIAVLEWIVQNPITVFFILMSLVSIYAIIYYRALPRSWRWLVAQLTPKAVAVTLKQNEMAEDLPDLSKRKFTPSSDLYCYWCTKKLGIKAWERNGRYYCNDCLKKL